MAKKNTQILILENGISFRDRLLGLCAEMGQTWIADDVESALDLLTRQSFQLLLLDWHLLQLNSSVLWSSIDNFQPNAYRIALFISPQLSEVIAAMKSGMSDVLWPAQDSSILNEKIKDTLSLEKTATVAHSYISQLAESLTDKAVVQKTPLAKARKEFSKIFLNQILNQQRMRRYQLANVLGVSPRNLYRYIDP